MDNNKETVKLLLRAENGIFKRDNGEIINTVNFYVDVNVDGENVPIRLKFKTDTLKGIVLKRLEKSEIELKTNGLENFIGKDGKAVRYYRFYIILYINGVPRKLYMKIAQGEKIADNKLNVSFERGLILNALGLEDEIGEKFAEEILDGDLMY